MPLPLQGFETETKELLGGMKENNLSPARGLPSRPIRDFVQKGNRKKIELEARPMIPTHCFAQWFLYSL